MRKWTPRHTYNRNCAHCGAAFTTAHRSGLYCSTVCRTHASQERCRQSKAGEWLRTPRTCGICKTEFMCTLATGPNKKYCSPLCVAAARGRDMAAFKQQHPTAMQQYNAVRKTKYGADTLMSRVRKKYPDLPTACEACGETRVLELAHKPEYARNGRWRTSDLYERHMFWVLCPTCHRVIDKHVQTPDELGLAP